MQTDPQLHHIAKRIAVGSLEDVIEVFELLGCEMFYREGDARWAMVGQHAVENFDIQLVEVDEASRVDDQKVNAHIAFISNDPKVQIKKVQQWASEKGITCTTGDWKENELWFDLPELFVDFVVEVMKDPVSEKKV